MKRFGKRRVLAVFILTAVFTLLTSIGIAADTDRMTKEELKKIMGDNTVLILDVRAGRDWSSSEFKIKGALRANPKEFNTWSDQYSKDNTLVLYCA